MKMLSSNFINGHVDQSTAVGMNNAGHSSQQNIVQ